MTKSEARKDALNKRKEEKNISKEMVDMIVSSKILDKYSRIGIYYPIGKEIDITELKMIYPNKVFFLPVTKKEIYFVEYNGNLIPGPFKTMEPIGTEVERDTIECFIIPCVGIGNNNRRIGYGKGFYDRYLNGYSGNKIGVVYSDAIYECECDEFDVVLENIFKG